MKRASTAVGINRVTAYKRRERCRRFARAWDKAQFVDRRPIGQSAMARAVHGERKLVFHKGEPVNERRTYSPTLFIHLLKAHLPGTYRFSSWRRNATRPKFQCSGYEAWERLRSLDTLPRTEERPRWAMRFLVVLRETGSVIDSCAVVGIQRSTAYRLRVRAPIFAAMWDQIIGEWRDDLEATAMNLATHGWEEPVIWKGEIVGARRRFPDTLAWFMLKARRPAYRIEGE